MGLFSSFLDLVFPPRCVNCGQVGSYFCQTCLTKARWVELTICPYCKKNSIGGFTHLYCQKKFGLDGLSSGFYFEGPIKKAVHSLKYRWVTDLQKELVGLWLQSLKKQEIGFKNSLLVPIPLFVRKQNERGFNQAEILAKGIEKEWGIELNPQVLVRRKSTSTQATLLLKERLKNLEDAFLVTGNVARKEIVLVDDVFTTGATLFSASEILKKAGAKKVWGLTLARSQSY